MGLITLMNPRGAATESAVLLCSTKCLSIFKLIVLDLELFTLFGFTLTALISIVFSQQAAVNN